MPAGHRRGSPGDRQSAALPAAGPPGRPDVHHHHLAAIGHVRWSPSRSASWDSAVGCPAQSPGGSPGRRGPGQRDTARSTTRGPPPPGDDAPAGAGCPGLTVIIANPRRGGDQVRQFAPDPVSINRWNEVRLARRTAAEPGGAQRRPQVIGAGSRSAAGDEAASCPRSPAGGVSGGHPRVPSRCTAPCGQGERVAPPTARVRPVATPNRCPQVVGPDEVGSIMIQPERAASGGRGLLGPLHRAETR